MQGGWDDFSSLFQGRGGDLVDLGHSHLDVFSLLKVLFGMTLPSRRSHRRKAESMT